MKKIVIIHFAPLELYPPVQNLIRALENSQGVEVIIFSTQGQIKSFESPSAHVKIKRWGKSGQHLRAPVRYWNYLRFYLSSFAALLIERPKALLYYETISSYPALVYKTYIDKGVQLFIHYHEYTSLREYESGMKLTRYFHKKEVQAYEKACWISHTNEDRMNLFKSDLTPQVLTNTYVLPNYPPSSWYAPPKENRHEPIRIVYVGALSLATMFAREFAQWVMNQNGRVIWHIYSNNCTEDTALYLKSLAEDLIVLHPGVPYESLPKVLNDYHVGVILYKGHIPNYIYNAPNKLFEYLACGLDVWLPHVMLGCLPYVTSTTYPRVVPVDFDRLTNMKLNDLVARNGLELKSSDYFCESALIEIVNKLTK